METSLLAVKRIGFHFRPSFFAKIKGFNFIISTGPIKMTNSKRFVLICNQFRCIMRVTCFRNQRCSAVQGSTWFLLCCWHNWWHEMVTTLNCLNWIRQNMTCNQFHYLGWSKGKEFHFYLAIRMTNKFHIGTENLKNLIPNQNLESISPSEILP